LASAGMRIMADATRSSMQPLFERDGMRRLDALVKPGVLCAFDFDGTLAPIVARPEQVRLPPGIRPRLVELARHAAVAIVTGRAIADIKPRLGFEPAYIVGNHGLEGVPGWAQRIGEYREICRDWIMQLASVEDEPGVQIEDKTYSLSVHYRLAPDQGAAADRLRVRFGGLMPAPHVIEGKCVFNLLPRNTVNKGIALVRLIEVSGAAGAVYVGDDVTDEDVFRLRRPDILTVRIEYAPGSAAEFFVPERGGIARVLDLLIARLSSRRRRAFQEIRGTS